MVSLDRFQACLLGCAIGEALGGPANGLGAGDFPAIKDFWAYQLPHPTQPNRSVILKPGQWAASTALMLNATDTLITMHTPNAAVYYLELNNWLSQGHNSCVKSAVGIPPSLSRLLDRYNAVRLDEHGRMPIIPTQPRANGDSSDAVMLAGAIPSALLASHESVSAAEWSEKMVGITHSHPEILEASRLLGGVLVSLTAGSAKAACDRELWRDFYTRKKNNEEYRTSLRPEFKAEPLKLPDAQALANGSALHVLRASLHCIETTQSFEEATLKAVNLGGASAALGSLTGAMAGALYGARPMIGTVGKTIPERWIRHVYGVDTLLERAAMLHKVAQAMQAA